LRETDNGARDVSEKEKQRTKREKATEREKKMK
jgi:hypothetical protein